MRGVYVSGKAADLIETVRRLRRLMTAYDSASIVLDAQFPSPDLEAKAAELRPQLDRAAHRVLHLLEDLEKHPCYPKKK